MNRWPRTIRIGSATYRLVIRPHIVDGPDSFEGRVSHTDREILVTSHDGQGRELAFPDIFGTFLHEVMHCVFDETRLLKPAIKEGMEEAMIQTLSTALARVLVDAGVVLPPGSKEAAR